MTALYILTAAFVAAVFLTIFPGIPLYLRHRVKRHGGIAGAAVGEPVRDTLGYAEVRGGGPRARLTVHTLTGSEDGYAICISDERFLHLDTRAVALSVAEARQLVNLLERGLQDGS